MGDPTRGVYEKFRVERTDGKSAPGQKHDGCDYFVLDLTHDKFADAALRAYAEACRAEYPDLARDLLAKLDGEADPWHPLAPAEEKAPAACGTCGGSREVTVTRDPLVDGAGQPERIRCPFCSGSGPQS